jgi:hypothetical protein
MNTISVTNNAADAAHARLPGLHLPLSYIIILLAWSASVIALSMNGVFLPIDSMPPPAMPIAVLLPPAIFLTAYRLMPSVRAWVASLDLAAVTALQSWRILGGVFMMLWFYDLLPALFAWPAGLGDVLVGLAAPWVTAAVIHKSPGWRRKSMALIAAGLMDFVLAISSGILTVAGGPLALEVEIGSDLVNAYPLVLIPALIVPMFIIFHLIAWIKIRREFSA